MSKKPVISKEAQVLLKLLRIALGTEEASPKSSPEGKDLLIGGSVKQWQEVVRLSYEHKVSAIAVDGLEASKFDPYEGLDEKQKEELKAVLVPWIKDVENTEWSYCYYVEVLKTLCQIFRDNGLTPIILKGYGLSLNYPRPSHRGAGNIDIYLVDKNGKSMAEKGDEIIREVLGLKVERKAGSKHSNFEFKGIMVENHYELRSQIFFDQSDIDFIDTLRKYVVNGYHSIDYNGCIFMPSPEFNALFLIRHMFSDFHRRKPLLRQFCDYFYFVSRYSNSVNWQDIHTILEKADLAEFSACVHWFFKTYLYSNCNEQISENNKSNVCKFMVEELFSQNYHSESGIANLVCFYKNREYYSFFHHKKWQGLTFNKIINHFKK